MATNIRPKTFVREERYFVLKKKDVAAHLYPMERRTLDSLIKKVEEGRASTGRPPLSCVVVEDDWPETPVIWSMIEARMTGGVDFVQWQAARISELEAQVGALTLKRASDPRPKK